MPILPARRARLLLAVLLSLILFSLWRPVPPAAAVNLRFADTAFERVWVRTDGPVAGRQADRSWTWGPAPAMIIREPFAGLPGGSHLVQYFDKSRMEINDPNGDRTSKWFVTNGLLTEELISGRVQTGLSTFEDRGPAAIALASDADDPAAPTYASFLPVSNTSRGDHPATDRTGGDVTATISRAGQVGTDPSRALTATRLAYFEPKTHHNIPGVFWTYLTSSGPVRENGNLRNAPLADPWNFATGLPISEPYWARVKIAGTAQWALIQAYERRVLTYVPANAPQWQVQMGNIGQHYYQYRYGGTATDLAGTLARMAAAPSYHFASLVELRSARYAIPFARQAGDFQAPDRAHFVQQGTDGVSEVVTIGATTYMSGTTTAGRWQRAGTGNTLDLSSLIGVLQYARDPANRPDEAVNGVPSRHVHVTLEPSVLPVLAGMHYSEANADVYIATATGLLTRLVTTVTLAPDSAQQGFIVVTADFSNYGAPQHIVAPIGP